MKAFGVVPSDTMSIPRMSTTVWVILIFNDMFEIMIVSE